MDLFATDFAHRLDALGQGVDRRFDVCFVFDDRHAIKAVVVQCLDELGEIEGARADNHIVPGSVGVEDEVLVVDAVDATCMLLDPFDGLAAARARELSEPTRTS